MEDLTQFLELEPRRAPSVQWNPFGDVPIRPWTDSIDTSPGFGCGDDGMFGSISVPIDKGNYPYEWS